MTALSIRQPWAWLIVNAGKDIENREWFTLFRGPVLIHAGKTMTKADYDACRIFIDGFSCIELPSPSEFKRGGIVGRCEIVDCVKEHGSPWFCGTYGFVLKNAEPLDFHPCKGALGFFQVSDTLTLNPTP